MTHVAPKEKTQKLNVRTCRAVSSVRTLVVQDSSTLYCVIGCLGSLVLNHVPRLGYPNHDVAVPPLL